MSDLINKAFDKSVSLLKAESVFYPNWGKILTLNLDQILGARSLFLNFLGWYFSVSVIFIVTDAHPVFICLLNRKGRGCYSNSDSDTLLVTRWVQWSRKAFKNKQLSHSLLKSGYRSFRFVSSICLLSLRKSSSYNANDSSLHEDWPDNIGSTAFRGGGFLSNGAKPGVTGGGGSGAFCGGDSIIPR